MIRNRIEVIYNIIRNIEKKSLLLSCRTDYCVKKTFIDEHLMMLRIVIYVDLTYNICFEYFTHCNGLI